MERTIGNNQYNVGYICTTLQCEAGRPDKIALRLISPDLTSINYSFSDLDGQSNKFANVLQSLGLSKGDVIFTLLPKMPEHFFVLLGALKLQLIASPLFANFGAEAILDRMGDAHAKILVTKNSFLKKIDRIKRQLPSLKYIIVVDSKLHISSNVLSYAVLMQEAAGIFKTPVTGMDVPSILHYTSGSTGKPKGVLHIHKAITTINQTTKEILDLKEDDKYWCTADQGWVTGTSYGMIGPWSCGVTQIHFSGQYDPAAWLAILEKESITVWYTAPTALRMLMKENASLFGKFNLNKLRHIYSVGEPLNPEIIQWSRKVLAKDVHDTWFMTETGSIMIANRPGFGIKPGSMGKPIAGVHAAIITDNGRTAKDGQCGNLCLKAPWPSMFLAYLNNKQAYEQKFKDGYYYSGDVAFKDKEGYYWFTGRKDDIINTAGHLVGPFEVESALLEIAEIKEAAVIGAPDETLFEKVVAFIKMKPGFKYNKDLELKIRVYIANKVSTIAVPQDIIVVENIPKTKSGKIMRRMLKAQYMGREAGDLSTLEDF
ncbi:MAG: AMP-binding protein [Candidatus Omnitrophota bacterium]